MTRVLVREEDWADAEAVVGGLDRLDASTPESVSPQDREGDSTDRPSPPPVAPSAPPEEASARSRVSLGSLVRQSVADCVLVLTLPFVAVASPHGGFSKENIFFAGVLLEPSVLGVGLWRRRRMAQRGELSILRGNAGSLPPQVIAGILWGVLMVGSGFVYHLIISAFDEKITDPMPLINETLPSKVLTFFAAVFVAPICEEVFFRGGILAGFRSAGHQGWGIVISSALFSGMHFSPVCAPLFFLDGIILGILYLDSRSLRTPIIAHAVANAGILAVAYR
jgi:membrane protease YdiL (CAAX protease family)